jgi:hypothetical protein
VADDTRGAETDRRARRLPAAELLCGFLAEEFHKPPERMPEQLKQAVMQLVNHAAESGQSEVQIYRFPSALCSDRGRRINNSEPGWETILEGRPKSA